MLDRRASLRPKMV